MDNSTPENYYGLFETDILVEDHLYYWIFDSQFRMIRTSAPAEEMFYSRFLILSDMIRVVRESVGIGRPSLITSNIGLTFSGEVIGAGAVQEIHFIGPVFTSPVSEKELWRTVEGWDVVGVEFSRRRRLVESMKSLPFLSTHSLARYSVILHRLLTGERIGVDEVRFPVMITEERADPVLIREGTALWKLEEGLLFAVQEGGPIPGDLTQKIAEITEYSGAYSGTPIERVRLSSVLFISLCSRYAIRGGISVDTGFSLESGYIRAVQAAANIQDIRNLLASMYRDFVTRTAMQKEGRSYTPEIRRVLDYVMLHADEDLSLELIADQTGYTPYYLSRKFRSEVGDSLPEYIRKAKLSRVKYMLISTDLSVSEICEKLKIPSRTWLSRAFRELSGLTPGEFRERYRNYTEK